jgi:D-sedoheptulose 7-phosphate isomerase
VMQNFHLDAYYSEIVDLIKSEEVYNKLNDAKRLVLDTKNADGKLILFGNGAGASIASHAAVDFTKQADVKALTLHDTGLITALSNDFGYDNWCAKAFEFFASQNDVLVCISVSGESPNLVKVAQYAKRKGHKIISLTGRHENNSLGQLADIHFHVQSHAYNIVEGILMIWLTSIVDMIRGEAVYEVS